MAKWLFPAVFVCATLVAAQLCAAQETPQGDSQATVVPEAAAQASGANSTVAEAPDPAGDDLTPHPLSSFSPAPPSEPFLSLAPASPRQPSEWRIIGSQWRSVPSDLLHDQKSIYLFPLSVARGHHLVPTLAIVGATALLMTVDAHDARWARNNTQPLGWFNNTFAGYNTATAADAFGGAFYLASILRRNIYDQQTFILAGEAVLDSEVLTTVMKDLDGREAPISYPTGGNFTDSWFKVKGGRASGWIGGLGSMPSGHEIAIVALATTFADRYPHPAWHRWVAYGLAAAVGLSRVTLQAHFTSDTFAGAALGYVIAHYVVLGRQPSN
jgi:membrane-associated phospholipid phosphatase